MIATKTIKIHALDNKVTPIVKCIQADSGRQIVIDVTDVEIPSGASARVYAVKPSKLVVYDDLTVNNDGTLTLDITNQMIAETGDTEAQVVITYGTETLTSFMFVFRVLEKLQDDNAIESTDEFSALEEALAQMPEAPEEDGSYNLQCTVSDGEVTYSWVAIE